jgi:hypothetical protein
MKNLFLLSILATSLSACATMFNGGNQTIVVNSTNPEHKPKARITTSEGSMMTQLPATVTSSPSTFSDVEIVVEDECFRATTVTVGQSVTGSYWANIFNIYGFAVDPLTGYMWKLDSQIAIPTEMKQECETPEKSKDS